MGDGREDVEEGEGRGQALNSTLAAALCGDPAESSFFLLHLLEPASSSSLTSFSLTPD